MLFICFNIENWNKRISVSKEKTSLIEIFSILGEKANIVFSIRIKNNIKINSFEFYDRDLKSILDEICENFDLMYEIEGDAICIREQVKYWKIYRINFFHEDKLSDLPYTQSNNSSDVLKHNEQNHYMVSGFWSSIKQTLDKICINEYAIDPYNGIISIYGYPKVHMFVREYIKELEKTSYTQIIIECKIAEIIIDENDSFDLSEILEPLPHFNGQSLTEMIKSFLDICNNISNSAKIMQVKLSADFKMMLINQQTGFISSSMSKYHKVYKLESVSLLQEKQFAKSEDFRIVSCGFSMSVVPIIINDEDIILKIRPHISSFSKNDTKQREMISIIKTKSGCISVLGGLQIDESNDSRAIITSIPILNLFFNKYKKSKTKSHFIIFIKTIKK